VALRFDVKQPNVKNHRKCQIHESSSPRKGLVPTVAKFFCRKKLKNEKLVRWILNPAMHAENMVNYRFQKTPISVAKHCCKTSLKLEKSSHLEQWFLDVEFPEDVRIGDRLPGVQRQRGGVQSIS
jgi:hypothetical protein